MEQKQASVYVSALKAVSLKQAEREAMKLGLLSSLWCAISGLRIDAETGQEFRRFLLLKINLAKELF